MRHSLGKENLIVTAYGKKLFVVKGCSRDAGTKKGRTNEGSP